MILFVTADPGRSLNDLADRLERVDGVSRVQRYGRQEEMLLGRRVLVSHSRLDDRESARYGLKEALPPRQLLASERLLRGTVSWPLATSCSWAASGLSWQALFPAMGTAP